jgi:stage V sporulation protein SpoVS
MTLTMQSPPDTLHGPDGAPSPPGYEPPANSFKNDSDHRFYLHPLTQELFVSSTTALGIISKDALPYWYGMQSSDWVLNNLLDVVRSPDREPCGTTGWDPCRRCLPCVLAQIRHAGEVERDISAGRGSRFHNVAEQYILTGEIIPHTPDIAGHVLHFLRFVDQHRVTFQATEATVINRAHRYAGTLDTVLTCGWMPPRHRDLIGVPTFTDWKTGNKIHKPVALQVGSYRAGEAILLPDGSEAPLPEADPDAGLCVQIRADGFWVRRLAIGAPTQEKFLRALALWRDFNEPGAELVGRSMYQPPVKEF